MGLKPWETIHPQIVSQSTLPFKAQFHSLLHVSPSTNLSICLLVLLRLHVFDYLQNQVHAEDLVGVSYQLILCPVRGDMV